MSDLNKIFKAYDVRGVVPDELDVAVAEATGAAFVRLTGAKTIVTLHDMRASSQPLAAALDHESWPEVVGTIAGDDTILVICPDPRRAGEIEARLRTILES